MKNKLITQLLIMALILLSQGCLSKKIPIDTYHITDYKNYLSEILNSQATNSHLAGKTKLKIVSSEINFTSKAIFFFKSPSSLHLEILNFFNQPHLYFIANNTLIKMYIPSENKVFIDKATKENISFLIGIPVDFKDLISFFALRTPDISLEKSNIILKQNTEHSIFEIINKNKTIKIRIDNNIHKISKYSYYINNSLQMEIDYLSYKQYIDHLRPSLIELSVPSKNYKLSIEFISLNFNAFSDDLFNINIPAKTGVYTFPSAAVQ